jgi:hypothetical protein
MIDISSERPEQSILGFVKYWIKLLADGRFEHACGLIDEPNSYGIVWTPSLINEVVNSTFSPDTVFYGFHPEGPIFTDPFLLAEQRQVKVVEFDDESGYAFDYALPLNGEWSDLTAQFEFQRRPNGYAVVLHNLHVL